MSRVLLELKARSEIRADMDNRNVNKFGLKMNICRYAFTYFFMSSFIAWGIRNIFLMFAFGIFPLIDKLWINTLSGNWKMSNYTVYTSVKSPFNIWISGLTLILTKVLLRSRIENGVLSAPLIILVSDMERNKLRSIFDQWSNFEWPT